MMGPIKLLDLAPQGRPHGRRTHRPEGWAVCPECKSQIGPIPFDKPEQHDRKCTMRPI